MAGPCPSDETLAAFTAGTLAPVASAAVAGHVVGCPQCEPKVVLLRTQLGQPAPTRPSEPPPEPVTDPSGLAQTLLGRASSGGGTLEAVLVNGSMVGRYMVLEQLGRGGMGVVYAAWDAGLERRVALKLIRSDHQGSALIPELKLRLLREAQAMARLSHPNVVTVHEVGTVREEIFLAMEFVRGQTLGAWLAAEPRTWRQILDVFLQAGEGLAAAHASGLTHRDFKPDNVLVSAEGRVRVMDFGLAYAQAEPAKKAADSLVPDSSSGGARRRITQPGTIVGTPAYMAIEQLLGQPTDPRTDQFSFCVALYEALYGERPFAGDTAPAVAAEISKNAVRPPPPGPGLQVPARLRQLLLKGLRSDPNERFRSMGPLLIGLSRRRSARERQSLAAAAVAALVLVSLAFAVQARRNAQRCAGYEGRLVGVWDDAARQRVREALEGSGKPWATSAWRESTARLDAWAQDWVRERKAACEDRQTPEAVLGARLLCLGRRFDDFEATARLLSVADAEVTERAGPLSWSLSKASGCRALKAATPDEGSAAAGLRLKVAQARARLEAGKLKEASALAGEVSAEAQREQLRALVAAAESVWGLAAGRSGDLQGAVDHLEVAVAEAEASHDDELAASAWLDRLGFAALLGKPTDPSGWVRLARAAVDRAGNGGELEASLASSLGLLARAQGHSEEAIAHFRRAAAVREAALGPEHPLLARALLNLGVAERSAGRTAEAIGTFRAALKLQETAVGAEHPAVADTLNNLGNALNDSGQTQEALAALQRSLIIKERAYGAHSLPVATALGNLGAVHLDRGEAAAAVGELERALAIKRQLGGAESVTVAITLTNLAKAQRALRQLQPALASDEEALAIRRKLQGPAQPELAWNLTGLGESWLLLGRPKQALAPLEEAVALRSRGGVDAGAKAQSQLALARAYLALKQVPQARPLLQAAAGHPQTAVEASALQEALPRARR